MRLNPLLHLSPISSENGILASIVSLPPRQRVVSVFDESTPFEPELCLSLYRFKQWWLRPCFGAPQQPETLLILWKEDKGVFGALCGLVHDEKQLNDYSLSADKQSQGSYSSFMPCDGKLFVTAGSFVHAITSVECGVWEMIRLCGQCYLGEVSVNPPTVDLVESQRPKCYLGEVSVNPPTVDLVESQRPKPKRETQIGFCSWNSMYLDVTTDKLVSIIQRLKSCGVKPGWLIIDDGWLSTTTPPDARNGEQWGGRLTDAVKAFDERKFPDGLESAIKAIKAEGVERVWVWCAIAGYWLGVQSNAEIPTTIKFPAFSDGLIHNDPSTVREASLTSGMGIPDNPARFYEVFHGRLKAAGVDGLKVDAQAIVGSLGIADLFGQALSSSFAMRFEEGTCCMSHEPTLLKAKGRARNSRVRVRSSDDYYPDDVDSHLPFVLANIFNSVFLAGALGLRCDFDMFNSSGSELQAMLRAVSGGAVYLSDDLSGSQSTIDDRIIKRLSMNGRDCFGCEGTLLPSLDSLFGSGRDGERYGESLFLKAVNRNRFGGVVFVFNSICDGIAGWDRGRYCKSGEELNSDGKVRVRPDDVFSDDANTAQDWMMWDCKRRQLTVLMAEKRTKAEMGTALFDFDFEMLNSSASLPGFKANVIVVAPIFESSVAILGFVDLYNAQGPIISVDVISGSDDNFFNLIVEVEPACIGSDVSFAVRSATVGRVEVVGGTEPVSLSSAREADCLTNEFRCMKTRASGEVVNLQFTRCEKYNNIVSI